MLERTTAINKILSLEKRIKIIQGGTSAGKTFGILPVLIDEAAFVPNTEISVVAESIPHLRRGALRDFEKIMKLLGVILAIANFCIDLVKKFYIDVVKEYFMTLCTEIFVIILNNK